MTWKAGFLRVAQDKGIGAECYRVLLVIAAHIDNGVFSPVSVREIGAILGIKGPSVHRALRVLVYHRVIRKRYTAGKLVGFEVVECFGEVAAPPPA